MCIGGCPMGGYGWGQVDEKELICSVQLGIENGINFFDTADTYGLGKSEETLGKAVHSKRNDVIIASKFGVRVENGNTIYDNSPEWINTAVRNSLKRLNTEYIDLYQIHYRDKTPIDIVMDTLLQLKKQGYIRYIGLSNIYKENLTELQPFLQNITSFQDEYSLACRKNEDDIRAISNNLNITPMTWGSLGQGILTGKYNEQSFFGTDDRRSRGIYSNFHGEKLKKNLQIVEELKNISDQTLHSIPAVAIRFILDNLLESVVLVGVKKPAQVTSNLEAFDWRLAKEQIERLKQVSAYERESYGNKIQ